MHIDDLIIVGGGPAGLAAAIAATREGLRFQLFEKGMLVNSLFHFPTNMVYFTTPELLEIGDLPFVTPYDKPTRVEALRYYRRVVDTYRIDVKLGHEVTAVRRERVEGDDGFGVEVRTAHDRARLARARAVVIAIGTFDYPNLLGVPGETFPHVTHYYREAHPYYRQQVVIVGGKNSAAEAALELHRAGAHVTLVHRRAQLSDSIKYWVRPDLENRIKEGSIAVRFNTRVVEITPTALIVQTPAGRETLPADAVLLLTGYCADLGFLASTGVEIDPATSVPRHHPETFETNVPGLFLAGAVVTGINSGQIFIENGRFHGAVVVAEIARRLRALDGSLPQSSSLPRA